MKNKSILVVLILILYAASELAAQDVGQNIYKYDDDQSDVNFAVMSNNEGQQAGMQFNIGKEIQSIDKIMIFVAGGKIDDVKANIHIIKLDENNADTIVPFVPNEKGKWNEIPVSKENITVSGNVMIAVEWITPTGEKEPYASFFIGADVNVSNHNGYIKHPKGDWYPARRFGSSGAKNFYIRLITHNQ